MMLRIIGGELGGRYIKSGWHKQSGLRPLAEVFRGALFNSLGTLVEDSIFLDAFAGTGAVGIEAISRGAKKSIFIEKHRKTASLIKNNLKSLGVEDRAEVIVGDVLRILPSLREDINIAFFGPPYDKGFIPKIYDTLLKWDKTPMLKRIIIQSSPREWQDHEAFEVVKDLSRGDTVLKILRYKG
ncbi:16S rRNA (guanine(966)-N(2))-methyltransferase RsmD [bacterium 3DAC]|nr:16S rRNA (guanine(966)-N(2))-methyltransferase RsmD [bacterium 3DAC]